MDEQIKVWHKTTLPVHRQELERSLHRRQQHIEQEAIEVHSNPVFALPLSELEDGDLHVIASEMIQVTQDMIHAKNKAKGANSNAKDLCIETIPLHRILILMENGPMGSSLYYVRSFYADFWRVYKQQMQSMARDHLNVWARWDRGAEVRFFEELTLMNIFDNVLYNRYVQHSVSTKIPIYMIFRHIHRMIQQKRYTLQQRRQAQKAQDLQRHAQNKDQLESSIKAFQWLCPSLDPQSNTKVDDLVFKVILPKLHTNERLLHKRKLEDTAIDYIHTQYPVIHHRPILASIQQEKDKRKTTSKRRETEPEEQEEDDNILLDKYGMVLQSFQDKTVDIGLDDYTRIMQTLAQEPDEFETVLSFELPSLPMDFRYETALYELDNSILHALEDLLAHKQLILQEDQRVLLKTLKERFIRQAPIREDTEEEEENKYPDSDEEETKERDRTTPAERLSKRLLDMEVVHYRIYMADRLYRQLTEYRRGFMDLLTEDPWKQQVVFKELQYQCSEDGGVPEYMADHRILWKELQVKLRAQLQDRQTSQIERLQQRMDTLVWISDFLHKQVLSHHQRNKDIYNTEILDTSFPSTHLNKYQSYQLPTTWVTPFVPSLAYSNKSEGVSCSDAYKAIIQEAISRFDQHGNQESSRSPSKKQRLGS
jgi:hypothetical protein